MKHVLLSPLLFLAACSSGTSSSSTTSTSTEQPTATTTVSAPKDTFSTGQVIPSVSLNADPSQNFALYLPDNYVQGAKFPVIIFFDPHGDGTVPLNLYKDLAGKFHYILIGSNSSKNGMGFEQTKIIADNLVTEAKTRFGVDQGHITFCGFSGGAKVALLSGASNGSVSTIIYCGAAVESNPDHPLTLLGFAGKRDMNYTDVVSFNEGLARSTLKHYLVEWGGKHEFPTADVFNDAFTLLATGTIDNYDKKQATITPEKMAEEQSMKQQLYQALQDKDMAWWKSEVAMLNAKKKTDMMYDRLLGFVSLACYSLSNNALQQNNLPVAEKILPIYALADPTNEDCKKFTAQLKQKQAGK